MQPVATVYSSRTHTCGISTFNGHLVHVLRARGVSVDDCNLRRGQTFVDQPSAVVQYVPSMWADQTGALFAVLKRAASRKLLVILHGLYERDDLRPRCETPCADLPAHVEAIWESGASILCLSTSCADRLVGWDKAFAHRITTSLHPGLFVEYQRDSGDDSYAFIGGISRAKKDLLSDRIESLITECQKHGTRIWAHSTSQLGATFGRARPWRVSDGLLSDLEWAKALSGAKAVLCPYDSNAQCVSGIVSEALSAGSRVFATAFPFALESQVRNPDLVTIENDLALWPRLLASASPVSRPRRHPTWPDFTATVIAMLSEHAFHACGT